MGAAPILTILRNGETLKTLPIESESVVGRGEGCVIRLEDRAISRQHAVLRPMPDGVQVERKSEFAPLIVNGAECTKAILKEGDVISIGPYLMKFSAADGQRPVSGAIASLAPTQPAGETVALPEPIFGAGGGMELAIEGAPLAAPVPMEEVAAPEGALPPGHEDHATAEVPVGLDLDGGDQLAAQGVAGMEAGAPSPEPADGLKLDFSPPVVAEMADEDAKTKVAAPPQFAVRLKFKPGTANVTDYEMTKDEVSIGRGKQCDVVLNDKKSSRKNAIIRRVGLKFVIKDLGSANGTFVNGMKIQEQELASDDMVRVGSVEFQFQAISADYLSREKNFMLPPPDASPSDEGMDGLPDLQLPPVNTGEMARAVDANDLPAPGGTLPPPMLPQSGAPQVGMGAVASDLGAIPGGIPGISGVPGIAGVGVTSGKQSLFQKYRNLPPRRKAIWTAIIIGILYFGLFDEDEKPKTDRKPSSIQKMPKAGASSKPSATFETLSPEQKRFVESQHALGFDLYKREEYDKALYEIRKIFDLIPDYLDSREIERYALEGQRRRQAIEDEKKKKEEEARLKAKIAQLIEETRDRMARKEYEAARDLFLQVLNLDPDNAEVAKWRKQIEEYEEKIKIEEQQKQVQVEINKRGWDLFKDAAGLKKRGKFHAAIETFEKVPDIGVSDKRLLAATRKMIVQCRAMIAAKRNPLLKQAEEAEQQGDFATAYKLYKQATQVDPPHPAGHAGIARVRGILHDKAKVIYTEAILAESYSDFAMAKKKFKECLDLAPGDDIYHERAERKLSQYFGRDETRQ